MLREKCTFTALAQNDYIVEGAAFDSGTTGVYVRGLLSLITFFLQLFVELVWALGFQAC